MGYIHIVGGAKKGKKIVVPKGCDVRPIQGFVRKAMFEILGADLEGSVVYDIFAGSGSLGLEALSRGAKKAYFFEKDFRACQYIRRNITLCGYETQAQVVRWDFWQAKKFPAFFEKPNIVFLDPPSTCDIFRVLEKLYNFRVVIDNAFLVVRCFERPEKLEKLTFLDIEDVRRYGRSVLLFSRLRVEENGGT
jgi:16S rRNA (guanine(966)-N(2))-methyltransferase RsmD